MIPQITITIPLTEENLDILRRFLPTAIGEAPLAIINKETNDEIKTAAKKTPTQPKQKAQVEIEDLRAIAKNFTKTPENAKKLGEIFAKFGAKKLTEIPEDRYGELMKELTAANG